MGLGLGVSRVKVEWWYYSFNREKKIKYKFKPETLETPILYIKRRDFMEFKVWCTCLPLLPMNIHIFLFTYDLQVGFVGHTPWIFQTELFMKAKLSMATYSLRDHHHRSPLFFFFLVKIITIVVLCQALNTRVYTRF